MNFIKMDGIGNEFIIIDARNTTIKLSKCEIQQIFARNNILARGCDQFGIIKNSDKHDCFLEIYNNNGAEVEACGNITRCVAYLLMQENKSDNLHCSIDTIAGVKLASRAHIGDTMIATNMGQPKLLWHEIPLLSKSGTLNIRLDIDAGPLRYATMVNVGNPHAVFFLDENIDDVDLDKYGAIVESAAMFPQKVNVSIANIIDENTINLRVFERGVGETLACGTASCATLVAAVRMKLTNKDVNIFLRGGDLNIKWLSDSNDIIMTGETNLQFEGVLK